MELKASRSTAAFAGAWAALVMVPFDHWLEEHPPESVLSHNVIFFAAIAIALLIPGYYFVIGTDSEPFSRTWFLDPEQRARYLVVTKRMAVWFISAAATGTLWSLVLMLFWK